MLLARCVTVAGRPAWGSVWLEDDPLGRSRPQTASSTTGTWSFVVGLCVASWCAVVAGGHGGITLGRAKLMTKVFEGSRSQVATGSRSLLEDVRWRRGLLPVGLDLVGSEVLVVGSLEVESHAGLGANAEFLGHTKPNVLLDSENVVAALVEDVFVEFEEVHRDLLDLGLWVELGTTLLMELSQLLDELLPFLSAINGMPGCLWWSHCNRC